MTTLQLRIVDECVKCGSITAASEKLNISQPNASASLRKLEAELGFVIFRRINGRLSITDKGYRFLEQARITLDADSAIRSINKGIRPTRLRVGVMNYSIAVDAFIEFCSERDETIPGELMCIDVSPDEGCQLLRDRRLDAIVSLQIKETLPMTEKICEENNFKMIKHGSIPICVRVRKDHPLVLNGMLNGSTRGFQRLDRYPRAEYRNTQQMMLSYTQATSIPFGCSSKIYVDERETRLRLVADTNAYSVGCQIPKSRLEAYGLVSIPTGEQSVLVTLVRNGDDSTPDVSRYLKILSRKLSELRNRKPRTKAQAPAEGSAAPAESPEDGVIDLMETENESDAAEEIAESEPAQENE